MCLSLARVLSVPTLVAALVCQVMTLDKSFLIPLLVMAVAFTLLFVTLHLAAMRNEILRRRVRSLQMMQASRMGFSSEAGAASRDGGAKEVGVA